MVERAVEGSVDPRNMFVIHGRNEPARKGLFEYLRVIGLDPIEWSEAIQMTGKGSPYTDKVFDTAFASAQAVVVLQTPDDVLPSSSHSKIIPGRGSPPARSVS
jgi:predicted nucleotide-binding protein